MIELFQSVPAVAWLALCIFAAAMLYSSVGHGGASGYLAAMALFGVAPAEMKPTALVLNLAVSAIAAFRFARAGHFSWPLFWPLAAASIPAAYLGGTLHLPGEVFRTVLGITLLVAAARFVFERREATPLRVPTKPVALASGGVIGLLSGLVGVGGGIFLTPLLVLLRWSDMKTAAAVSALFIFVNSASGLAGHVQSGQSLPTSLPLLAFAAVAGGLLGSHLGVRHLPPLWMRRVLTAVLGVAAAKLLLA